MESRLKERLTGAAILVALIVLIVPEIFRDRRGRPPPTAPPAGDAAASHSYTIELGGARAAPGALPPSHPAPTLAASAASAAPAAPVKPAVPEKPTLPTPVPQVRPSPPAAGSASAASPGPTGSRAQRGWTVQLGLFAKAANAQRLAHSAQGHGFAVQITRYGTHALYRVAVEGVADRAAAERLSHRLHAAGLPAAILGPR